MVNLYKGVAHGKGTDTTTVIRRRKNIGSVPTACPPRVCDYNRDMMEIQNIYVNKCCIRGNEAYTRTRIYAGVTAAQSSGYGTGGYPAYITVVVAITTTYVGCEAARTITTDPNAARIEI